MLKLNPNEIESYLRHKGFKMRRRGQKAEFEICPFCNGGENGDKWKCVVYLDDTGGNYKCMRGSCGVSGSFWQLVEHFGDNPKDYYQRDERRIAPLHKPITFKAEPVEPYKLTDTALDYLNRRGFSTDTLDDVAIWCDDKGQINFGYYHKGELCLVKVRQPRKPNKGEPKAWQAWKEGLRTLWGIEQLDYNANAIAITFGEYDRIALMQCGLGNVVSVPCGDSDLEWISICYEDLQKFSEIILWIDNDKSGQDALPKIAERLGKEKIRVVKTDFKDANEMLVYRFREVGIDAYTEIAEAVNGANWYYTGDVIQLIDVAERDRQFTGYTSGFPTIDKSLGGFYFGSLTVHTGDSKHGKSAGVNQIMAQAIEEGGIVCVWAGEDEIEDFKYKMYVHLAGWDGVQLMTSERTGTTYAKVLDEYKTRIDRFLDGRLFVLNKRFGINEETLFENFDLAFRRYGCDTFVIDNLMKLVAAKDTQNVNFRQAQIINKASDFAKSGSRHVHIVTHTNKAGADNEPPTKKNVSGAKEITNLADNVLAWWRVPDEVRQNFGNNDSVLSILANRAWGEEVVVPLVYDRTLKRYGELRSDTDRKYSL